MTTQRTTRVVLDGLAFPEGPRWHDGSLWFSDMYANRVVKMDPSGKAEVVVEVPTQPSGLGFTPEGALLIVSMLDNRLLRLEGDGRLATVADLSPFATGQCNDMVVDGRGRAYVGNLGYDVHGGGAFREADLVLVGTDGTPRVVARGLALPNGTVITPDGRTLIIAESRGYRLTAFDIADDGSLSNRRLFADLGAERIPDGICLDAEGAVWVALPRQREFLRVLEGGRVTERIGTDDKMAVACVLGGPDRRTLYLCTARSVDGGHGPGHNIGWIEATEVEVPGAGWP